MRRTKKPGTYLEAVDNFIKARDAFYRAISDSIEQSAICRAIVRVAMYFGGRK